MSESLINTIRALAEVLPQLGDNLATAERSCRKARQILQQALPHFRRLAEAGFDEALSPDRYIVIENWMTGDNRCR